MVSQAREPWPSQPPGLCSAPRARLPSPDGLVPTHLTTQHRPHASRKLSYPTMGHGVVLKDPLMHLSYHVNEIPYRI